MFYTGKFDQWLTANWFLNLLATTLEGAGSHDKSFKHAESRTDLVKCLRYRYSEDSALMDDAPIRVLMWDKTHGEWSSLTKGGCRYLHQCRSWFVEMARVWTQQGLRWDIGIMMPLVTRDIMHHATFKISPVHIASCNFRDATHNSSGLNRPRSFKVKKLELDPSTVKNFSIGKHCKKLNSEQVPVILEWARENPTLIAGFFAKCSAVFIYLYTVPDNVF